MAEVSMLWTTNGTGHGVGTGYASNRWQAFIRKLLMSDQTATACVLNGVDNELAVSGTASPLSVASGAAIDYAFFYENDAPKNLTVSTPSVGTTGGHVILEANWAAQTVTALAVRNTDGVSGIPALTQTANTTWQVRLATFTITVGGVITLTDVRKRVKFSNHVYANGFDTSAVDNSTIELGSGALRVKDGGITPAKLAAAIAGNGLAGGAGTALSVNVDSSSIEINADTLRVKALGITTAMHALNSVDDTIAGDRVPQFYRRQGASATDWSSPGSTSQTPAATRIQAGVINVTISVGNTDGSQVVTFPAAFSQKPLFGAIALNRGTVASGDNTFVSATQGRIWVNSLDGGTGAFPCLWIAIGAE